MNKITLTYQVFTNSSWPKKHLHQLFIFIDLLILISLGTYLYKHFTRQWQWPCSYILVFHLYKLQLNSSGENILNWWQHWSIGQRKPTFLSIDKVCTYNYFLSNDFTLSIKLQIKKKTKNNIEHVFHYSLCANNKIEYILSYSNSSWHHLLKLKKFFYILSYDIYMIYAAHLEDFFFLKCTYL